jgi:hypothetical protein
MDRNVLGCAVDARPFSLMRRAGIKNGGFAATNNRTVQAGPSAFQAWQGRWRARY